MGWLSIGFCSVHGIYSTHPEPYDRDDQTIEPLTEALRLSRYRQSDERVCAQCANQEQEVNVNSIFPSNYLKAADLNGKQIRVTIERIEMETLGQGNDAKDCPVIYFEGKDKGLVANKTNMTAIAAVYGDETDDWIGAEVVLFEAMATYNGKTGPALRVKIPPRKPEPRVAAPKPSERNPPPAEDDDIPF